MALNGGGFSVKDGHFFLRHFRISVGDGVIFRRVENGGAPRQIYGAGNRAAGKGGAGKSGADAGSRVKRSASAGKKAWRRKMEMERGNEKMETKGEER